MLEFIAGLVLGAGGTYVLYVKKDDEKGKGYVPPIGGYAPPKDLIPSPSDCKALVDNYIKTLPDPAKGVLLSAIASKNSAGLEVAATAVQGVNPSLAACLRELAKAT